MTTTTRTAAKVRKPKAAATKPENPTPAPKPRRTINVRVATNHVHKNLIRRPKSDGASEFAGLSLDSVENFRKDVSSHLADSSNLATSTIDRADYEELLEHARELEAWKPKPTAKKAKATAPLATATKENQVTVKVSAPVLAPTPTLLRKAKEETTEETPTKKNRVVPGNWRYMAEHADTASARAWWSNYCDRRMRGEV